MYESIFNYTTNLNSKTGYVLFYGSKRSPRDGEDDSDKGFSHAADSCIPSSHPLTAVSQFTALVASDGHIMVITTTIPVSSVARQMQGKRQTHSGGSISAGVRCGG